MNRAQCIYPLSCGWAFGCFQVFAPGNRAALSVVHAPGAHAQKCSRQWARWLLNMRRYCQDRIDYLFYDFLIICVSFSVKCLCVPVAHSSIGLQYFFVLYENSALTLPGSFTWWLREGWYDYHYIFYRYRGSGK